MIAPGFESAAPAKIVGQVLGGDAVEAIEPLLEAAVIGIDVVDVEVRRRGVAAMIERARKRLSKSAKKGFRGWPVATVALYGPDDTMATKLTVGIVPAEDAEATDLRRWLSKDQTDIRDDIPVAEEVLAFITEAGAKSVVMTDP